MENTQRTAKVLTACLQNHSWLQSDLAEKSGIAAQTLSAHLNGSRVIRDDHLAAYIKALDRDEQHILLSAWLRDTLDETTASHVLEPASSRVSKAVRTYQPGLTAEQIHMLNWWAHKLASDDELDSIFKSISRRAGWVAPVD